MPKKLINRYINLMLFCIVCIYYIISKSSNKPVRSQPNLNLVILIKSNSTTSSLIDIPQTTEFQSSFHHIWRTLHFHQSNHLQRELPPTALPSHPLLFSPPRSRFSLANGISKTINSTRLWGRIYFFYCYFLF